MLTPNNLKESTLNKSRNLICPKVFQRIIKHYNKKNNHFLEVMQGPTDTNAYY
jgi:hypothetical protein